LILVGTCSMNFDMAFVHTSSIFEVRIKSSTLMNVYRHILKYAMEPL
jgi:hypothetical protein